MYKQTKKSVAALLFGHHPASFFYMDNLYSCPVNFQYFTDLLNKKFFQNMRIIY